MENNSNMHANIRNKTRMFTLSTHVNIVVEALLTATRQMKGERGYKLERKKNQSFLLVDYMTLYTKDLEDTTRKFLELIANTNHTTKKFLELTENTNQITKI